MALANDLLNIYNTTLTNTINNTNFFINTNAKLSILEYLKSQSRLLQRMAYIHIEKGLKPQIRESSYIALTGFKPPALINALFESEIRNNILWVFLGNEKLPLNEFHNIMNELRSYFISEGLSVQYILGYTCADFIISW